jgi:hypothetical protein
MQAHVEGKEELLSAKRKLILRQKMFCSSNCPSITHSALIVSLVSTSTSKLHPSRLCFDKKDKAKNIIVTNFCKKLSSNNYTMSTNYQYHGNFIDLQVEILKPRKV